MRARVLAGSVLCCFVGFACDSGEDPATSAADNADESGAEETSAEGETGTSADTETGGETTDGGPLDSDQDGLSDEEEAVLGTDPLLKDTDADSYWDSWELDEGTDPLDVNSRIYVGYWPYNPNKDALEQGTWATASKTVGSPMPRQAFVDHHGDMVDLYDFTNFTGNAMNEPAFFIFDLSAQWCGPCHNVGAWLSGVDDANTSWIQDLYPTVRGKVHGLRIWWITFLVQDAAGAAPTGNDAVIWAETHNDAFIPVMADVEELMWPAFGANAFPHFFLLDPEMRIEYFPPAGASGNANPYPAVGLVDTLL